MYNDAGERTPHEDPFKTKRNLGSKHNALEGMAPTERQLREAVLMVSLVDGHGYLQYNVSARAEICTFRAI
jgi:hypothetical protein